MESKFARSFVACAPLLICLTAVGQDSSLDRRHALLRGQGVRPEIVGNRLAVICSPSAHSRQFTTPATDGNPQETLSIQLDEGHLRLRYESLTEGQLVLEVCDLRQVRIQRHVAGKSVVYTQAEEGPVTLEVTAGGKTQTRTAPGLWQMLLFERLASEELIPMLDQLRPQWGLAQQAQRVEQALLAEAGSAALAERAQWEQWLNQLGSPEFSSRVQAQRKLREMGVVSLGWLERQDPSSLDAEQRSHLSSLRSELLPVRSDTPDLVAAWLLDDPRAWLGLLNREDVTTRTLARKQLELLCQRTIAFDPQADPTIRREQVAKLQARLGK